MINAQFALAPSRGALHANLVDVALAVALNLTPMWLAPSRPRGSLSVLG